MPGGAGRRVAGLALALAVFAVAPSLARFDPPPAPPRFVHDGAGLLSPTEKRALEDRVLALDRERGLQIGVAIEPSLHGEPLEEATLAIAEAWKPGHEGRDDGVLIAVFVAERKIRIEIGYGLEGAIPDAIAARIIRNVIAPAFRAGRHGDGLLRAVDALAAAAAGETEAIPESGEALPAAARVIALALFVALVVLLMVVSIAARARLERHRTLHGGRVVRGDLPLWVWLLTEGASRGGRGGPGGGFGGGFGGGSSFGGGSFGGGGASGGW